MLLNRVARALERLAQDPGGEEPLERVASYRAQLDVGLARAQSNQFSPAWRQALEELGLVDLFGEGLRVTIREVIERHEATLSTTADELEELANRVQAAGKTVDQLLSAFEWLDIGWEELDVGEFEVGVLIPRPAVSNELGTLGDELVELKRILLPFAELSTGSRPDFEVRSISSSDFQVFLESPGATAACIAIAVERLVKFYKVLLDIRLTRQALKDAGASEKVLGGFEEPADQHMAIAIGELVDELVSEFGGQIESGRANELMIELRLSLNALANRIDRGYIVEVRAGLPPEPEDEQGDRAISAEYRRLSEAVLSRQEALRFVRPKGSPMLSLPEPEPEPEPEPGSAK